MKLKSDPWFLIKGTNKNLPIVFITLIERVTQMNNIQKNLLLALIFTTGFGTNVMAHKRNNFGHVIDVQPVFESRVEHRQVAKTHCRKDYQSNKRRVHDAMLGSLIGSIIGNAVSDAPGFGALGAIAGIGVADSRHRQSETCHTVWRPERYTTRLLSHYEVSIVHRGRTINIRSEHPYRIGEHIRFVR